MEKRFSFKNKKFSTIVFILISITLILSCSDSKTKLLIRKWEQKYPFAMTSIEDEHNKETEKINKRIDEQKLLMSKLGVNTEALMRIPLIPNFTSTMNEIYNFDENKSDYFDIHHILMYELS